VSFNQVFIFPMIFRISIFDRNVIVTNDFPNKLCREISDEKNYQQNSDTCLMWVFPTEFGRIVITDHRLSETLFLSQIRRKQLLPTDFRWKCPSVKTCLVVVTTECIQLFKQVSQSKN
jgi:hypothetical protein